jgi:hypothetical protein
MARDYILDAQAAKEANTGGMRITESGRYTGRFTAAWYEQNDKGTESVHFLFKADDGREAGPLALYTHNGAGEPLPSYKTFNAILTCLKVRGIKAVQGKVALYDYNAGGMVEKVKPLYPELANKPIGLLLQGEEYAKSSGDIGTRMIIVGPFDPATGKMAAEILANTEPKALASLERWLEVNPVKKLKNRPSTPADRYADSHAGSGSGAGGAFDDDIPFAPIPLRQLW